MKENSLQERQHLGFQTGYPGILLIPLSAGTLLRNRFKAFKRFSTEVSKTPCRFVVTLPIQTYSLGSSKQSS